MARSKALGLTVLVVYGAIFFILLTVLNENVFREATSSVSGSVTSLMLCEFKAQRIPTSCAPLPDGQKERVISAIRQGHAAQTPSHGKTRHEYFLIVNSGSGGSVTTKCFVLVEFEDFESSLYLLPINTGNNCSGETFKYAAGSVRLENFLRSANR